MSGENMGANYLEEYKDVGNNWRYWGDTRFKQITVYLTITGVLFAGIVVYLPQVIGACYWENPHPAPAVTTIPSMMIAMLGFFSTYLFFILEERSTYYRRAYLHRAFEIEELVDAAVRRESAISSEGRTYALGELWQYRVTDNIYWKCEGSATVFKFFFGFIFFVWAVLFCLSLSAMLGSLFPMFGSVLSIVALLVSFRKGRKLQRMAGQLDDRREKKDWKDKKGVVARETFLNELC